MRIPDEGKYKNGSIRVEEVEGYQSCIHCDKCGLTRLNQIFTDGSFYCRYLKSWKRGDDIYEYHCPGYRQKTCDGCWRKKKFHCRESISGMFCNRYVNKSDWELSILFMGRVKKLRKHSNPTVLELEAEYAERKREALIAEGIEVPTIKDVEFKGKLENINKSKEVFKSWGGNRYPSYVKGVKSKSKLNKMIEEFFKDHPLEKGERPPLVNELAVYLGFASERDLFRIIEDIRPERDVEVQNLIARAVGMIQNAYNDLIINTSLAEGDYKGISDVLNRQERMADRYAKKFEGLVGDVAKIDVNVTVDDKLKELLDGSLKNLNKHVAKKSVDAEFHDVEPAQIEAPKPEVTDA